MAAPTMVADGVHRLGTRLVNWYVIEEAGRLTFVDSGVPGYHAQFEEALSTLGRAPADVEAVVLTHPHPDHVGLAERIRREAGARVLLPAADAEMARTGKPDKKEGSMLRYLGHGIAWRLSWHLIRNGGARIAKVEQFETFADGDVLDVPGRLRVVATPGHTEGHAALHLEAEGVLFTGDAMCSLNPLTGREGPQLMPAALQNSTARALASLDRIAPVDAGTLLFGHGEPWTEGAAKAAARAREVGPT
jgi:glyoxylase-like metal-dependent hydrolase (beta-lactamase superfamily II)